MWPLTSPTATDCSKTAFPLGVKWASVGQGAAPCHWHWHSGQAKGELAGCTAPECQLKLRGKATEPAQNPLIQIAIDVCDHEKGGSLFQSGSGQSKQLWWTMSRERSREVQGTNKYATMLASRQQSKSFPKKIQNNVYCACKGGLPGAEVRKPVSNGQICIWVRMCKWC
jgi:hypothetical protein